MFLGQNFHFQGRIFGYEAEICMFYCNNIVNILVFRLKLCFKGQHFDYKLNICIEMSEKFGFQVKIVVLGHNYGF